ncbi:MAG: substrate-binding domain-containing protein [Rhizobiaceae bacterium]
MKLCPIRLATLFITWLGISTAQASDLRVAVTTSFNNSGLSDILLPEIKKDLGLNIHLLVVGTGQALKLGRSGDVDAILVHSKTAEEQFVAEGYGTHRREIMYNDFVLIGPSSDPADTSNAKNIAEALKSVFDTKSIFTSRGDDSGTHRKELSLWKAAGVDAKTFDANWYRAAGAGMGATLNTASGMNAYILADRASWLKFKNKGGLKLLFSGDPLLFNQYAFLPIDPTRHPHAKNGLANQLETWLTSKKGQQMIADYTLEGEVLFTPNANKTDPQG